MSGHCKCSTAMTLDLWEEVGAIRVMKGLHCNLSWDLSMAKKIIPSSSG